MTNRMKWTTTLLCLLTALASPSMGSNTSDRKETIEARTSQVQIVRIVRRAGHGHHGHTYVRRGQDLRLHPIHVFHRLVTRPFALMVKAFREQYSPPPSPPQGGR